MKMYQIIGNLTKAFITISSHLFLKLVEEELEANLRTNITN